MRLLINESGLFLGVKEGMVEVRRPRRKGNEGDKGKETGEKALEVAVPKLDQVSVLTRSVAFSSDFVRLLSEYHVPLVFYSGYGYPEVVVSGAEETGSVLLRKAQYEARKGGLGVALAKSFVYGKLMNQRALLYSMARNRKETDPELAKKLLSTSEGMIKYADAAASARATDCDGARVPLMEVEANAASEYWNAVGLALFKVVEFPGRKKRYDGATDPVNVALNYLYTVLGTECALQLKLQGLDPYAGFLHEDSPRRPGLAMDLIEEFREPVVDRAVIRLAFERKLDKAVEGDRLTREARKEVYRAYAERMEAPVTFLNRRLSIQDHLTLQARRIGEHVMGRDVYAPFR
ncbi:MAG: CRISPR-associated endonuclease Cas1, partial [Thermoprotei archaeon]